MTVVFLINSTMPRMRACIKEDRWDMYGNIWLPITWVITRPPIKQDLG